MHLSCEKDYNMSKTFELTYEVIARDGIYYIDDEPNLNFVLIRGLSYRFNVKAEGHPFWIKTKKVIGTESTYNKGVKNNGLENGFLIFDVPMDAPDQLYYACQFHETMQGDIKIMDPENMSVHDLIQFYK